MLNRSTKSYWAALALILATATYTHADGPVQIAEAELYEQEWQIKPGGDWWGIFPDGKDGYTFQPTRVSAVPDPDEVVAPEKARRQIRVPGQGHGTFVLRGLMSASAGALKSVKLEEYPAPLGPGETFVLRCDGDTPETRLRLLAAGRPVVEQIGEITWRRVEDYELWLQQGSGEDATMQLLFKEPEVLEDERASLRWAGDLDRDGKLDLIYNLGGHYTKTRLALYLSSAAKPGELVGLVARWDASCGC
jgi:hypothetical protein